MKVAWLIVTGPEALKRQAIARLEMIADTFLSVSTPAQHALPVFLQQRENFHRQWLKRAQNNLAQLDALLATQELCTRLETEGGWYVVLKVPLTAGSDELAMELLTDARSIRAPRPFLRFSRGWLFGGEPDYA